jgi:hypothetical protein
MDRPKVIRVAKTPKSAYNPHRNASSLLLTQVAQIEKARQLHPQGHQVTLAPNDVRTEGDAAEFIGQVTRLLHPAGAAPEPPSGKARPAKAVRVKRRRRAKTKTVARRVSAHRGARRKPKSKVKKTKMKMKRPVKRTVKKAVKKGRAKK